MHTFLDIYNQLEDLHIVPRWKWHSNSIARLSNLMSSCGIKWFLDNAGNVVLNCASKYELNKRLSEGSINLILQAHMDHPGAIVTKTSYANTNLYCLEWLGGYGPPLEGKFILVYDTSSGIREISKIEITTTSDAGTFIYLYAANDYSPDFSVAHFYDRNLYDNTNTAIISSWALDDLVGCASIIQVLSQHAAPYVIGLLTMGEEIGGHGIKNFVNNFIKSSLKSRPYFINVDTPAEEGKLMCGGGVWLRYEDKLNKYDSDLVDFIQSNVPGTKTISLTKGETEASALTDLGCSAASIAIPIRNIHNGSRTLSWTAESMSYSDAMALRDYLVSLMATSHIKYPSKRNTNEAVISLPNIGYINVADKIYSMINDAHDYCDFLLKYSALHAKYNDVDFLPERISSQEYDDIKDEPQHNGCEFLKEDVVGMAYDIIPLVAELISDVPVSIKEPVMIFSTIKASFNSRNSEKGIIISLDKIRQGDLRRCLSHELTHWLCSKLYCRSSFPNYLNRLLSEGLACYVSREVCKIDSSSALGIPQSTINYYDSIQQILKDNFYASMCGDMLNIFRGEHHTALTVSSPPHPFIILRDNKWNKYGYYLGLLFIDQCLSCSQSIRDIMNNSLMVERLFKKFIKQDIYEPCQTLCNSQCCSRMSAKDNGIQLCN